MPYPALWLEAGVGLGCVGSVGTVPDDTLDDLLLVLVQTHGEGGAAPTTHLDVIYVHL